jgi:hypothetical protein
VQSGLERNEWGADLPTILIQGAPGTSFNASGCMLSQDGGCNLGGQGNMLWTRCSYV